MTRSILVAAREPNVGISLSTCIRNLGWSVAGPFRSNVEAWGWLGTGTADGAILNLVLEDGSTLQLADALHHAGIPYVFFADFDDHRKVIRSEAPDDDGGCREAHLRDLLSALEDAASRPIQTLP